MKINFRRYLYMLSIALLVSLIYNLDLAFLVNPYSFGGVKHFDNFNKTWPFTQGKMENVIFKS